MFSEPNKSLKYINNNMSQYDYLLAVDEVIDLLVDKSGNLIVENQIRKTIPKFATSISM